MIRVALRSEEDVHEWPDRESKRERDRRGKMEKNKAQIK